MPDREKFPYGLKACKIGVDEPEAQIIAMVTLILAARGDGNGTEGNKPIILLQLIGDHYAFNIALDHRRSDHVYNFDRLVNGALLRCYQLQAATLGPGRISPSV